MTDHPSGRGDGEPEEPNPRVDPDDEKVDEQGEESFPASDPPSTSPGAG